MSLPEPSGQLWYFYPGLLVGTIREIPRYELAAAWLRSQLVANAYLVRYERCQRAIVAVAF